MYWNRVIHLNFLCVITHESIVRSILYNWQFGVRCCRCCILAILAWTRNRSPDNLENTLVSTTDIITDTLLHFSAEMSMGTICISCFDASVLWSPSADFWQLEARGCCFLNVFSQMCKCFIKQTHYACTLIFFPVASYAHTKQQAIMI